MSDLGERISREFLPYVQNVASYIGGEVNQIRKDWHDSSLRVCLAFPDTYAIGTSCLAMHILYDLANRMDGVVCERVYCPWIDAEQRLRQTKLPLYTLESRRPVGECDIVAFSVQYELLYTNILTMLDLSGIPLHAADRGEAHPLVVIGGPQADNPEPLADFIDVAILGDAEESWPAFLASCDILRRDGVGRQDLLRELARRHEWVYVPSLYEVTYASDNTIAAVKPCTAQHGWTMPRGPSVRQPGFTAAGSTNLQQSGCTAMPGGPRVRCATDDLEHAPAPTAPIVPWVSSVHDRINIEIMRGCPHRCRFCHASHTKRPLRSRSVDTIVELAEANWRNTGMDEITLTSLSSADYEHLDELTARLNDLFSPRKVSIALPSLRVDKQLELIAQRTSVVRKGGLTIAPEVARPGLRAAINKRITDEDLLAGVEAAYQAGFKRVKLYFMCGFPGETEDDVRGIYDLACRVADIRRSTHKSPGQVTASVSWLVPKPHTPLQWAAQQDYEYFRWCDRLLRGMARGRGPVSVKTHSIRRSLLEGVLSRGDRRVGAAILAAWRHGARFDSWDDMYDDRNWQQAFDETGVDPAWYAQRERDFDEVLPWGHLQCGTGASGLWTQYQATLAAVGEQSASDGV